MPFGSLSTLAVMNPGPSTARNSTIRVLQRLSISSGQGSGNRISSLRTQLIQYGDEHLANFVGELVREMKFRGHPEAKFVCNDQLCLKLAVRTASHAKELFVFAC